MAILTTRRIADLLAPYVPEEELSGALLERLGLYLDLLVRWNTRTNLTAIRDPEAIVQRQMGESLFAAQMLPVAGTLLDFGSGAGFPGIPLQMLRPSLRVTLAESQGKKASFLREAVRTLNLKCSVWPQRVEAMPASLCFDTVVMRAVDSTSAMLPVALTRLLEGGGLLRFLAKDERLDVTGLWVEDERILPLTCSRVVRLVRSLDEKA